MLIRSSRQRSALFAAAFFLDALCYARLTLFHRPRGSGSNLSDVAALFMARPVQLARHGGRLHDRIRLVCGPGPMGFWSLCMLCSASCLLCALCVARRVVSVRFSVHFLPRLGSPMEWSDPHLDRVVDAMGFVRRMGKRSLGRNEASD